VAIQVKTLVLGEVANNANQNQEVELDSLFSATQHARLYSKACGRCG
jgi:hypothetical protein